MPDDPKPTPNRPDAPAPAAARTAAPPPPPPPPAHDLVAAIRAAVSPGAHDQGSPPPSTEIVERGRFKVGDRYVDCDGNTIK